MKWCATCKKHVENCLHHELINEVINKNENWRKTVKKGLCNCKLPTISAGYVPPSYQKLLIICGTCNRRLKGSEI